MTQLQIKLSEHTSPEDVAKWPNPRDKEVLFVLARASSFEAGAEGLAHSFLASALQISGDIYLNCEFSQPQNDKEFFSTVLASTFGYTLIRATTQIKFAGAKVNSMESFRIFAGKLYDHNRGVIGLGDRVELIAFDPKRSIPKALLIRPHSIDQDGLPLPSAFQADLLKILAGMGLPEIGSQSTLPTLISFVYELFLNTLQHGLPKNEVRLMNSTRGIALTKIAFSTQQLVTRKISTPLRQYLERIAEMQKRETNLLVVCISVMDMGDGIQNTLPSSSVEETAHARLARAFKVGESRKAGSSIERGLGLHKVVEAAFRLGARLQVSSAGKILVKDFSLGEDPLPRMDGAIEQTLPDHFIAGTSIEMYVLNLLTDIDQRKLLV